jgi:bifunctional oligoribonuclease and PAP phosphatase NrnA
MDGFTLYNPQIMNLDQSYDNMTAWLAGCRRPLLVSHRRPDGDALGALAGMALALTQRGQQPQVALYEPFPARYALLRDATQWLMWSDSGAQLRASCDALVIVDTCSYQQLEPLTAYLPTAPRTLVLDHHTTVDPIGTRPGDFRVIDSEACAVSMLVAEWARRAGIALEPRLATALFTGIATDCGWFRFPCTDARTLHVAAELVAAGAKPSRINAELYEQDATARLRLIGRMLNSLELHADHRLAVMYIRRADFEAAGADHSVTEDLVNEASRLGCTEATLLFTEEADGAIRVNLRSKRTLDVSALAATFGGGGHVRAAGARLRGRWEEQVPPVIAAAVAGLGAEGRSQK